MSLLDAILMDPAVSEVHIALRTCGSLGSGTAEDPWNGGVQVTTQFTISSATYTGGTGSGGYTVTLTTSTDHGFKTGDIVLITGFQNPDGELLNGSFVVTRLSSTSFSYFIVYTDTGTQGPDLSPTLSISGSPKCQADPYLFDRVMRKISVAGAAPTLVRLGPGVFETKGYEKSRRGGVSWEPVAGLKIRGSGMDVTTLKLVQATYRHLHYFLIGVPQIYQPFAPADGFEVSELTCDCNIASQPSQKITVGAVSMRGSHTRFRRVRAVNFGRQGVPDSSPECFVFLMGGSSYANTGGNHISRDCIVEECVVESPGLNNVKESSMITVSTSESEQTPGSGWFALRSLATVIRNCRINCEYQTNPVVIASVTRGTFDVGAKTLTFTVDTVTPHGLQNNSWARVSAVRVTGAADGGYDNPYNGSFQVVSSTSTSLTFQATELPTTPNPPVAPDSVQVNAWVGRFSSDYRGISLMTLTQVGATSVWQLDVTTAQPHFLVPDVYPAPASGLWPAPGSLAVFNGAPTDVGKSSVDGVWNVTTWLSARRFVCKRDFAGQNPPFQPPDVTNIVMGVRMQGVSDATVIEGSHIANCTMGGPYIDTWGVKEMVVRDNYYTRVRTALYFDIEQPVEPDPTKRITLLAPTLDVPSLVATFETRFGGAHGLSVGQGVLVRGVKAAGGVLIAEYNRSFFVLSVASDSKFTVQLSSTPSQSPSPSFFPTLSWLHEVLDVSILRNVVELLPGLNAGAGQTHAWNFYGARSGWFTNEIPPGVPDLSWRTHRARVFENIIRYACYPNGTLMSGVASLESAVTLTLVEQALVDQNIIDIALDPSPLTPIKFLNSGTQSFFNNTTPAGVLVQGYNQAYVSGSPWNPRQAEVATTIDDALALSLL